MQTKIKNLGKLKRELEITIPEDTIKETGDKVYQDLKNKVSIKGFRKGKFPKHLMEKRFQENIEIEVKKKIIPEILSKSIQENSLKIATQPKIDSGKIEKNKPFSFTAKFELFPEFQLPVWKEVVKIKKFENKLQEQEIANYVLLTTLQNYEYKAKTTAVKNTDKVEIKLDIQEIEKEKEQRQLSIVYYVGSNEISAELDQALLQMEEKQKKELELTVSSYSLSQDIAGKKIKVKIEVLSIFQKIDAPTNKEFYQKINPEVTSENSLFDFCKNSLKSMREKQNENKEETIIRDAIIKNMDFEVPQELVDSNLKQYEKNTKDNQQKKMSETETRKIMTDNLRYQFVLAKVIEEQKITATQEELREAIIKLATSYNTDPSQLVASEYGKKIIDSIRNQLEEQRSLDFIRKNSQRI